MPTPTLRPIRPLTDWLRTAQTVSVIILLLIFITLAVPRIWALRVAAERSAVLQTLGALHTALAVQVVTRARREGLDAVAALEHANPMEFLDPPPVNYQRLPGPVAADQLAPRHWYFDPVQGVLIYRLRYGEYLDTALAGPPRIRLQVQLLYADHNGNQRYDADSDRLDNVSLVPLDPYRWRTP